MMKKTDYENFLTKLYRVDQVDTFKALILRSAEIYRRRTAFIIKDSNKQNVEISYEKLLQSYQALVTSFLHAGLAGKKIAVTGKNCFEWALTYLAASTVGIVMPLDKELSDADQLHLLHIAECTTVVGDATVLNKLLSLCPSLKTIAFSGEGETVEKHIQRGSRLRMTGDAGFEKLNVEPDATTVLIFTSGTTGSAKGVCLSQRNICSDITATMQMVKIRSKARVLSMLPLHHTYECSLGFLAILYSGACITYCDGLRYINRNITEYRPSVLVVVPLIIEKILEKVEASVRDGLPEKYKQGTEKLSFPELLRILPFAIRKIVERKVRSSLGDRLELLIVGAASVKPDTVAAYNMLGIRTLQGYGLTETSPLVVGNNDFYMKPDSVGFPIPGVKLRIAGQNPETGIGEIYVSGKMVMQGYYNDKEATDAVLKDGWFHTGDLGYVDAQGYVYITGRIKNVIVTSNGKNIYPEELEEKLNASSLISESMITGDLNLDDEMYVKAKIYPDLDALKLSLHTTVPTKEEIYDAVKKAVDEINEKLPSYKRIRRVIIRDKEFEKTTTRKIKRHGDNMKDD